MSLGGVERRRRRRYESVTPAVEGIEVVVVLDVRLEIYGAGGEPERRPPAPRERGRGRGLLERGEVEDTADEIVGEFGQAVIAAAGHRLRTYVQGWNRDRDRSGFYHDDVIGM